MFICICQQIRESDIDSIVDQGVSSEAEARRILGACTDCGECKSCFRKCFRKASNNLGSQLEQKIIPIMPQQVTASSSTR